jgi:hypothetical protein
LDCLEDESLAEEALESLSRELMPRPSDHGRLSGWLCSIAEHKDLVCGAFAARRARLQKLDVLALPHSILRNAKVRMEKDPDNESFACVSNLHLSLFLENDEARQSLAMKILEHLENDPNNKSHIYFRIQKKEIRNLLSRTYQDCLSRDSTPESEKISDWAHQFLGS